MFSATAAIHPLISPATMQPSWAGMAADRDRAVVDRRGALAALLAGRDPAPRHVRDEIAASWRRSAESGLKPADVQLRPLPGAQGDGPFLPAARPALDQLVVDLTGTPVGVVLANAQGQVVERCVSDPDLRAHLDSIGLAPGSLCAEDVAGTNGIGTALAQRRPVTVDGDEHFADALTTVACAAALIADRRCGRIIGVIGLASLAGPGTALMLPLAARAAREIEQLFVDAAGVSERLLLQRFLQERLRAKGPLVLVTDRTMIANAAADRLVDTDDEPLLRECAARAQSGNHGEVSQLVLTCGTEVTVRGEPLLDGASRIAAILRIKAIADAGPGRHQARDRRPAFGWESLTDTERSVLALVAEGLTNRQAGEQLFLSHHTIGFHLRSIYCKLGVNSRVELTRLALEHDTERDPGRPEAVRSGLRLA